MKRQVQQLGYENFDQFAQDRGLVAFTSQACPPCRAMKPELAKYAERGHNVAVVDLDESPDIFTALEINALPTILAFKGGEIKGKRIGGQKMLDLIRFGYQSDVLAKKEAA